MHDSDYNVRLCGILLGCLFFILTKSIFVKRYYSLSLTFSLPTYTCVHAVLIYMLTQEVEVLRKERKREMGGLGWERNGRLRKVEKIYEKEIEG